ncbi:MAG: hypothetical protein WCE44_07910 [Candidatus Velthaea sp.]
MSKRSFPVTRRPARIFAAACVLVASALPVSTFASSTGVVSLTISAPVLATITVTSGTVTCNVTSAMSTTAPCTTSASISGYVRSSYNTITKLTVTGAAVNNSAVTYSVPATAFAMTCTDASSGGTHGALTVANATPLSTSAVSCASWAANAAGNVLNLSDNLAFTINSYLVPADTYTATNWTITLTAS